MPASVNKLHVKERNINLEWSRQYAEEYIWKRELKMRNFKICRPHQILFGEKETENKMGWAYGTNEGKRYVYTFFTEYLRQAMWQA